MKLLPFLLLNLATVGVGILAYDQLRAEKPQSTVVESARSGTAALEPRVEALEAERRPTLGGMGIDPRVLARLDALEEQLGSRAEVTEDAAGVTVADNPSREGPTAPRASPDEPGEAELSRWRRVRDAVRRQDTIRKSRARFDKALDELSINLTPRQREKIYAVRATFEPRIHAIWGEVKAQAQETVAAGGTIDGQALRAQGAAQIQQEFAETITGIVHQADAEAVAGAMLRGGK